MSQKSKASDLERLKIRLESWRKTRKRGQRIPRVLWDAAVKVADELGVHKTAKALRLEYYALKRRVKGSNQPLPATPAFIELAKTPLGYVDECRSECTIELESVAGASMRLHFKGVDFSEIASLSQSFWEGK